MRLAPLPHPHPHPSSVRRLLQLPPSIVFLLLISSFARHYCRAASLGGRPLLVTHGDYFNLWAIARAGDSSESPNLEEGGRSGIDDDPPPPTTLACDSSPAPRGRRTGEGEGEGEGEGGIGRGESDVVPDEEGGESSSTSVETTTTTTSTSSSSSSTTSTSTTFATKMTTAVRTTVGARTRRLRERITESSSWGSSTTNGLLGYRYDDDDLNGTESSSDPDASPSTLRRLFLDRIALLSSNLLRSDNATIVQDDDMDSEDDMAVTHQSDLTLPNRRIFVVTTAALPWMTGTAVNPLLRAAHLCRMTKKINEDAATSASGNETSVLKNETTSEDNVQRWVTLVVPWLELEEDRRELYGSDHVFRDEAEQEAYIRTWMREEADLADASDPDTGIRILFYPARYHQGLKSIFAMGDICSLIPDEDADVCVLEEPEHLNWYRAPGDGWTAKFDYVVGIMHTNYKEYASGHYSGLWTAPAIGVISSAMVRAYCHKVIKLSDVLQTYAPEKEEVSNVHGVREEFLREGARRAAAMSIAASSAGEGNEGTVVTGDDGREVEEATTTIATDEAAARAANAGNGTTTNTNTNTNTYFIGKILWAKGLHKLVELEEYYRQCTGSYFSVDVYGSGDEMDEIKRAFHGRRRRRGKRRGGGGMGGVRNGRSSLFSSNRRRRLNALLASKGELEDDSSVFVSEDLTSKAPTNMDQFLDEQDEYGGDEIGLLDDSESSDSEDEEESDDMSDEAERNSTSSSMDGFYPSKARWKLAQLYKSTTESLGEFDMPKSRHEWRRNPIPAHFHGRVDHALLKDQYKVFVNPSKSEVLCTTTAEALAMGKFVVIPLHPSNAFFSRFPNCLLYRNKLEFAASLRWALTHDPEPLTPELAREFTWEAATERFVEAAAITKKEARRRAKLGRSKLDERIAYFHNELGKGAKGDAIRKVLGGGPVSHQVKYEMEKKESESMYYKEERIDEEEVLDKFEGSWLTSAIRTTFSLSSTSAEDNLHLMDEATFPMLE